MRKIGATPNRRTSALMLALLAHPAAEHERIGEHACLNGLAVWYGARRARVPEGRLLLPQSRPLFFFGGS